MITLRNITLRRGVKVVLKDASVTLQPAEKVGLIGRNGAGKSSLFAMLTDKLHADAGDVEIPPRWRIGEVAQEMPETDDGATDYVLQGDLPLLAAQAEMAAAEASGDGDAMAHAHLALEEAGAYDASARAQALLLGLGFKGDQLDAPVNSFSGGWRMRLQLARALMCPAELLLLDEPTNHLDLDALVWLEAWLKRFDGLLVIISHDREFLDAICKVIVHLDEQVLTRYTGNYTAFEAMRSERIVQAQAAFSKQQDRIQHLQKFIDRFKAKASKAKQAQSRVKALQRMEKLAPVLTASDFTFEFREPQSLPNPMLAFDGLACGYMVPPVAGYGDTPPEGAVPGLGRPGAGDATAPRAVTIVSDINRSVLAGQRIGILGANGQGKSTLVKTIAGQLQPTAGVMTAGKGLVIGYFAQQELDVLQLDDGPLMHMVRLARDVGPAGREQELREVCDEFWLVTRGGVLPFDGDLDDYQKWLLDVARATARGQTPPEPPKPAVAERAAAPPPPAPATAPKSPAAAAPTKAAAPAASRADRQQDKQAKARLADATRPLRNEVLRIDARLATLAAEKAEVEALLSAPQRNGDDFAELGRRLSHVAAETAQLEERWLVLHSELEAMGAAG